MAKILFTWELGSGYGHLLRMLPLALKLRERGHEVVFLLRNLEQVEQHFGRYDFAIYQAPIWQASSVGMPAIASYADILLRHGFFDVSGLTGLVKSWNNYFQLLKSDLIIFDHSPTALLASRCNNIPRIIYGNGFEIPPAQTPLPSIRWWDKAPDKRLVDHEQKVLQTINQILKNNKQSEISSLSQLFSVDDTFLATFKELDQYPSRLESHYYGIPLNDETCMPPDWPLSNGKKIFVYLNQHYTGLNDLVRALDSFACCVLIHSPGLSNARILQLQSANINFSNQAVNINLVNQECSLTICHSGVGTGTSALLAGHPVLLIPNHIEQYSAAKRITEIGAGILVEPKQKKVNFKQLLRTLLENPTYSNNAKAFSEKYKDFDAQKTVEELADRCEQQLE
jgi:UDP:flavonoid glycosyltransferase YjiC (YdhE family)